LESLKASESDLLIAGISLDTVGILKDWGCQGEPRDWREPLGLFSKICASCVGRIEFLDLAISNVLIASQADFLFFDQSP
jgi:hypothetical protein